LNGCLREPIVLPPELLPEKNNNNDNDHNQNNQNNQNNNDNKIFDV
jgi:hypothetical protein